MKPDELAAFNEVQKEKEAFGIDDTAEPESEEPAETTPEVIPEATPEEEPDPSKVADREPEPTPKDFKTYKVELRAELQADYDKKFEDLKKELAKSPEAPATEHLEDEIASLAKELDFDPEKTRKLIEVARKGVETLSPEDKKAIEEYRSEKTLREQERVDREQNEIFETEWNQVLPSLKEQYPNASPEQISAAKAQIDELAHSEKYADTDIDYVLFKEKESIGKTLFSPKKSTFESARPVAIDTESDEWPEITANMTPNQIVAAERKREKMMDSMPKDKLRITTRDDGGRAIERYE